MDASYLDGGDGTHWQHSVPYSEVASYDENSNSNSNSTQHYLAVDSALHQLQAQRAETGENNYHHHLLPKPNRNDPRPPNQRRVGSIPMYRELKSRNELVQSDKKSHQVRTGTNSSIRIGDSKTISQFYQHRFQACQQTACKLIAKAWIKTVEPKKQSKHPYTGPHQRVPDWWPKPWGPASHEQVRHKEPDHLYRRERICLLTHILSMVVEPAAKQHTDIQLHGLDVKKLEKVANLSLSSYYRESTANSHKQVILQEIFDVARQEERYKKGEIKGHTVVLVGPKGSRHRPGHLLSVDEISCEMPAEAFEFESPISAAPANSGKTSDTTDSACHLNLSYDQVQQLFDIQTLRNNHNTGHCSTSENPTYFGASLSQAPSSTAGMTSYNVCHKYESLELDYASVNNLQTSDERWYGEWRSLG